MSQEAEAQVPDVVVNEGWDREAGDGEDEDGDGYSSCEGMDCDDNNLTVHPFADEICDALDNNCNGEVDEGFDGDRRRRRA